MGFDVFLQDFSTAPADRGDSVGHVLRGRLGSDGQNILTSDGSAAVFGALERPLTGLMFNHLEGKDVWDVVFDVAVAADWVVMPVGGPVCIVRADHAHTIPGDLADTPVVLVHSGDQLRVAATS